MDDVSATGPSKSMSWTTFYITNHRPIQWHGRSRFNCHCSRNHLEQVWTGQPTGWQCLWWQQTEEDLRMHILWFMVSVWPRFGHLWPEFYGCKMGFMELCRQWLRRRRGGRGTRSVQVLGIGVNGIFVAKDRQSETDGGIGVESPAKAGPRHGLTIDWWICIGIGSAKRILWCWWWNRSSALERQPRDELAERADGRTDGSRLNKTGRRNGEVPLKY